MSNTQLPLLEELARVADSRDIKDQLSVIFRTEVFQDSQKMRDYYRLSNEITEAVRMRDEYMKELQMLPKSEAVCESVAIMRRMQVDDMQVASRLMLMATEMQMKFLSVGGRVSHRQQPFDSVVVQCGENRRNHVTTARGRFQMSLMKHEKKPSGIHIEAGEMCKPVEPIPIPPTSVVRNTVEKENEQTSENPNRPASDAALQEYCDKHYHQLLPLIAEKVHQEKAQQDKLKEVKARLNFKGCSGRNSKIQEVSQHSESRTENFRGEPERRRRSRRSRYDVTGRNHLDIGIPRGKWCSQGWEERKEVYSTRWGVKEDVCPHARINPDPNGTGTPKEKRRAATRVPIQEKRNPFPESVTTKERLRGERNCSRKVKILEGGTGSQG
ncbi:hypothetical protein Tco_0333436 [Tanacetum coccineum]